MGEITNSAKGVIISLFWLERSYNQLELNKIIKAQKKAIRNICKAQYNEHTDPLLKKNYKYPN